MAKYNWEELKEEYIVGEFKSVSEFLKYKNISQNGNTNKKTKSWNLEKSKKEQKKSKKVIEKVIEEQSTIEAKNKLKINDVANKLLNTIAENANSDFRYIKSLTSALKDISDVMVDDFEEEQKDKIFIPVKDIGKDFVDLYRDIKNRNHDDYWLEGGRGSLKSSFVSELVVEELENNPNWCALCIRKIGNTLQDSIYSQVEWGFDKLTETYPYLKDKWKFKRSPLEIINKQTNQRIFFRGADDPNKIKSIKPPKDKYIAIIVYEEFDQMNGMEEVRKIDLSAKRGGNEFITFRIYNTPKSKRHFVNIEKIKNNPKRLVKRTTYLDAPVEFLGKPFFDDAEILKENNYKAYENEYLGKETGLEGSVFENLELREITEEEISNFDYLYQGIDFGWFPDPLAWTKMCYQPNKLTLYIFDEFVVNKMSNADVWKNLQEKKKVKNEDLIHADSAEPKSIADFRSYGSVMRSVKKGPDSVKYSMKWLSSLAKIVIDPKRCPITAEEFTKYEFMQDKEGNYISEYIDEDNHCIDSVRYAMNPVWRRKGE